MITLLKSKRLIVQIVRNCNALFVSGIHFWFITWKRSAN